ncbi:hypothetical protein PFBG_01254 [Plasmodium falciparum 7G8]|uniref:Uncharacterized protein n=1 Tax=Plasmodium falciparum (isolate 7G8) TaxID=57266 RepID=W7FBM6_PLAF8|nr:hypothetical protein PFBG_01254 [Plasmodium falciparum 7G8]
MIKIIHVLYNNYYTYYKIVNFFIVNSNFELKEMLLHKSLHIYFIFFFYTPLFKLHDKCLLIVYTYFVYEKNCFGYMYTHVSIILYLKFCEYLIKLFLLLYAPYRENKYYKFRGKKSTYMWIIKYL